MIIQWYKSLLLIFLILLFTQYKAQEQLKLVTEWDYSKGKPRIWRVQDCNDLEASSLEAVTNAWAAQKE